jgi:delta-aminolevulinic acid dehydratase/porphobilinogen synthase
MNRKERIEELDDIVNEYQPKFLSNHSDFGFSTHEWFDVRQREVAEKALTIIHELEEENKKFKEVIIIVDTCLSDYVTTEHGIKIINEKDLGDAQILLTETLSQLNQKNNAK